MSVCGIEDSAQLIAHRRRGAGLLRQPADARGDRCPHGRRIDPDLPQDRAHHAFLEIEQNPEQVQVLHGRVALPAGDLGSLLQRPRRLDGQTIGMYHGSMSTFRAG